jgi:hypothetical protein
MAAGFGVSVLSWLMKRVTGLPTRRAALTPGCQMSYMDHTGCDQLKVF